MRAIDVARKAIQQSTDSGAQVGDRVLL